ncbi:MAG TPA: DUF3667 domain-containing protein [Longimicrobium sp.]|nr:DUF3667 domain-containing protein [Longimicrobium sp.]
MGLVLRNVVSTVFGLDRGLLHTFLSLSRNPGRVAGDYVAGATVSYTNPASYLLLCASITALLFTSFGGIEDFVRGFNEASSRAPVPTAAEALRRIAAHASIIVALVVPVTALFSRIVFYRSARNYAEHLVFNAFVLAQAALMVTVLDVLSRPVVRPDSTAGEAVGLVIAVIGAGYYTWAACHFFQQRVVGGLLRAGGVLLLATLAYGLLAGVAVAVVGSITAAG